MLDLHQTIIVDNPPDLADWPITTTITDVEFQYNGGDGVHVEFSKRDGPGAWPDVLIPGWMGGTLEYTLGLAERINGQWYASAAIEFWSGLPAAGGNLAFDLIAMGQCSAFGYEPLLPGPGGPSYTCQVAGNWYYGSAWGAMMGYQPATGELIGIFVVAGNTRHITSDDPAQSPVMERSNVVLVPMPDINGGKFTF